jgi:hypothetical protein
MIKDCVAGYTVARKALQLVFPAYEMPEHKSIDKYYEDLAIAEDSPVPAFMQEEFKQKEEETKRYIGGLIGSY